MYTTIFVTSLMLFWNPVSTGINYPEFPATGLKAIHTAPSGAPPASVTDKVTFRVDTRNTAVAPSGMFIAGSFFSTIGYTNWTFIPMCNLGSGIWEISFANIPPGLYQYKFVNGNNPPGWEFNGFGGPCTNPADNNNRWVTVTGGEQLEGPHCINTCNMFCNGLSDPGVSDNTPPVLTSPIPADISLNCGNALPPPAPLNADDGCDANATTTTGLPTDDLSALTPCGTGQITRTWEVTDCAGNTTTADQIITVTDLVSPVITSPIPGNITVACGNLPPLIGLNATDACDASITNTGLPTEDLSGVGPCGTGTVVRTWSVTDCSGNTRTASQSITLTDNTPPTIPGGAPGNITVACGNVPAPQSLNAFDNCDASITSTGMPTDNTSGLNACGTGQLIRTWSVTDCSGNTRSVSQTITVTDNVQPVITGAVPPNTTISCTNSLPPGAPLTATDNCDISITTTSPPTDNLSGLNACGTGQIIRTWSVTDCAGNTRTATQIITVTDVEAPQVIIPPPPTITVSCGNLPTPVTLPVQDACDQTMTETEQPTDDLSGLGACGSGTVIRHWTATDCSGNSTTISQTIVVEDDTPPVITASFPPNISITCGMPLPTALPLFASDACDASLTSTGPPVDNTNGLNACGVGVILRTWSATDCGGNSTSATQTITVSDLTPPVLTIPANTTMACGSIPPATAADAVATDNCGSPVVTYQGETTVGSGCSLEIHRSWTAVDCGGNSVSKTQIITITDTEPPVFVSPPADLFVCVGNVPPMTSLTWTDNCDGTGVATGTETSDGMSNPETITRTWTYTDACGNTAAVSQVITVSNAGMANVGPDLAQCGATPVQLSASGAGGAASVLWTTTGDGAFSNPTAVNTIYSPGLNDLSAGSVVLTFTPQTAGGNCTILPDALTVTISPAPVADAGNDQTVNCLLQQVTLNGGSSSGGQSILYQWSGPGINSGNMNLPNPVVNVSGSYTLTVSDGTACSSSDVVEVFTDTIAPLADAGPDRTLTCTQTTVTLDGSGTPLFPGISFLWSGPGIAAQNATQQSPAVGEPGTYILQVSNAGNGCTALDSVSVMPDANLPTADAGQDQTLNCITNTVLLGGSSTSAGPGIVYQWTAPDGTPLGTDLTQIASSGGVFSFTVLDTNNGCAATAAVEVVMDTLAPVADAGINAVINCSASTVPLGGSSSQGPAFQYSWYLNGLQIGSNPLLTTSLPGAYTLFVQNTTNGCTDSDEVVVQSDTIPPIADAGSDGLLDCASSSVVLDGSGSSAGAAHTYMWEGPGFSSTLINPVVSVPGIYVLTVTNTLNNCTAADTVLVTTNADFPHANAGPDLNLTCTTTQVALDGSNSSQGQIFEYHWSDTTGQTLGNGLTLTVSTPGTYVLTVLSTLNGCAAFDQVTVGLDTLHPLAVAGPDLAFTCNQTSVLLDGSASFGNGLSYFWQGPGIVGDPTAVSVEAVTAGIYSLTVSNLTNGCTDSDQVIITPNPDAPIANAGPPQTITCAVLSVTLQGTASAPSAMFHWNGPGIHPGNQNLQTPTVSQAGVYQLVVTDPQTGCSSPPAFTVVQIHQEPPHANVVMSGTLNCQSTQVLLDGSGSVQGDTILYQWLFENTPLPGANDDAWFATQPGVYQLVVTNSLNGCTNTSSATVQSNIVLPPVAIQQPAEINCRQSSVTLEETAASNIPGIVYSWSTPNGSFVQTPGNSSTAQAGAEGQYIVSVTNPANGCSASDTVFVHTNYEAPVLNFNQAFELSCSEAEVTLFVEANASASDFTYSWSGNGFSSSAVTPKVSSPGAYGVTVTLSTTGCTASSSTVVNQISGISEVVYQVVEPQCLGDENGVLTISQVYGSNGPFTFSLDGITFTPTNTLNGLAPGAYTLTVKDEQGCLFTQNFEVLPVQGIFLDLGEDVRIPWGDSIQLSANTVSSITSYEWSNAQTLSCKDCPNPFARPSETTTYTLVVTHDNGCTASDMVRVVVDRRLNVYFPSAFSPNNDGINDYFTIFTGNEVQTIETLQVFDRWGAMVFDGRNLPPGNLTKGWDGYHQGKPVERGVYVFWASLILPDGTMELLEGAVTLIR
jgi:gliding motility-associated-like protein